VDHLAGEHLDALSALELAIADPRAVRAPEVLDLEARAEMEDGVVPRDRRVVDDEVAPARSSDADGALRGERVARERIATDDDDLERGSRRPAHATLECAAGASMSTSVLRASPALVLAGCSLLTPYEDLTAGRGAVDAGSDAAAPPSATGAWCEEESRRTPDLTSCSDFDREPLDAAFRTRTSGGAVTLEPERPRSEPNVLRARTEAVLAGGSALAEATRVVEVTEELREAFDVEVPVLDPGGARLTFATVALFDDAAPARLYVVSLSVSVDGVAIDLAPEPRSGAGTIQSSFLPAARAPLAWTRIGLVIAASGSNASISVTFDGALVLDRFAVATALRPRRAIVSLGAHHVSAPSSAWTARYDNVAIVAR